MKISWNWLREILPVQISAEDAAALLTDIGLEVEALSHYESVIGSLEGLVVGEVLKVVKHPNADTLKLTEVNAGDGSILHIVCGAPNVAAGQKVIVAKTGTTIHPLHGDPVTIKKAKIRGEESEGMLCAEDEIGLGEKHEGLYLLPQDAEPGQPVSEIIHVYNDVVFEIGLTANHADANSQYGVARELYAALHTRNIENTEIQKIDTGAALWENSSSSPKDPIRVAVENTRDCLRYAGILIEGIGAGPSPQWMQDRLRAVGMRPINHIVDVTNYILQELGQPIHAFDADKIRGHEIHVKNLPAGTKFTTLDGRERVLHEDDLMICDAEGGICIAGIYGGLDSGVTEKTTRIFLESACFNPAAVRGTERRLGLKTDASARFARGTDPGIPVIALKKATALIMENQGPIKISEIIDICPGNMAPFPVTLRYDRLASLTGVKIPVETVQKILTLLNIRIQEIHTDRLTLEVPGYKNDVRREIDVIEEVLRLYGYNKVPLPDTIRTPFTLSPKPDRETIRLHFIAWLAASGYYEIFTNAISRSRYGQTFLPASDATRVHLMNSQSADLDSMRQHMLFSGLEVLTLNISRRQKDLRFFELGRTYAKADEGFAEREELALYVTGMHTAESWKQKQAPADFFDMKTDVHRILRKMHLACTEEEADDPLLENALALCSGDQQIGIYGQVRETVLDAFEIRQPVYFARLNWEPLLQASAGNAPLYREVPRFPEVRRDLALLLRQGTQYADIEKIARNAGGNLLQDVILFDVYEGIKTPDGAEGKSYAIGLVFRAENRTLTDAEVDSVMQTLMRRYEKELGATIRRS